MLLTMPAWDPSDDHSQTRDADDQSLPDDITIIHRVRDGDTHIFEALFQYYAPRLASFVYRYLRSREESEDVVQEVFLRIWRNRADWHVRGTINDYLYLAARNHARDRLSHDLVVRRHADAAKRVDAAEVAPDVVQWLEDHERLAALMRLLSTFPERRRTVCLLRWRDGLSYAEIARQLGVSTKTVENQLARALKILREQLAGA